MKITTRYKGYKIFRYSYSHGYVVQSASHVAKGFKSLEDATKYIDTL